MKLGDEVGAAAQFGDMAYRLELPEAAVPPPPAGEDAGPVRIARSALDVPWERELELADPDLSTYLEAAAALGRELRGHSPRDPAREADTDKVATKLRAAW